MKKGKIQHRCERSHGVREEHFRWQEGPVRCEEKRDLFGQCVVGCLAGGESKAKCVKFDW